MDPSLQSKLFSKVRCWILVKYLTKHRSKVLKLCGRPPKEGRSCVGCFLKELRLLALGGWGSGSRAMHT